LLAIRESIRNELNSIGIKIKTDGVELVDKTVAEEMKRQYQKTMNKIENAIISGNLPPSASPLEQRGAVENPASGIMITTPHNEPPIPHAYDTIVEELSEIIGEHLKEYIDRVLVLHTDTNRMQSDMNRIISRDTKFREKVRKEAKKHKILLDLHSYPPHGSKYSGYDMCLLHVPEYTDTVLLEALKRNLESKGYHVGIFKTPEGRADLIVDAKDTAGIEVILLEVNEKYQHNLEKVGHDIAHALISINPLPELVLVGAMSGMTSAIVFSILTHIIQELEKGVNKHAKTT
jgi:hypothetical protein